MGHSIAAGVAATGDAPGWLILPADMPMVRSTTLTAVAQAIEHDPIAYAQHRGRRGHPVGFNAELFSEAHQPARRRGRAPAAGALSGTGRGRRRSGVLIDVDTVEDLQRLAVDPSKPRPSSEGLRSLG